jgi:hypothetical protein
MIGYSVAGFDGQLVVSQVNVAMIIAAVTPPPSARAALRGA